MNTVNKKVLVFSIFRFEKSIQHFKSWNSNKQIWNMWLASTYSIFVYLNFMI